jgi:acylphosphatase
LLVIFVAFRVCYTFAVLAGRRYVVKGRVQRVGFRLYVEDAARREGLRGYVRNQHDGSVEVVAEGESETLFRFEQAVRRGPPGARVDEVETIETEPTGRFNSFFVTG